MHRWRNRIFIQKRKNQRAEAEDREREEGERADYIAVLNELKKSYNDAHQNDKRKDCWSAIRETVGLVLIAATTVLTATTFAVFYAQLLVSENAVTDAHRDADTALKQAHRDSTEALLAAVAASEDQHADTQTALTKADTANGTAARALEAANRAIIAPRNIDFSEPYENGKPVKLTIRYEDTGHDAAEDVSINTETILVNNWPSSISYLPEIKAIGANKTCKRHSVAVGGSGIAFPSSQFAAGYSFDFPASKFVGTEDIKATKKIIVGRGCFTYRTFLKTHHSAFCYLHRPDDGKTFDQARWGICPIGNWSD